MKEAFPNLKFVGENAKEFEQMELTDEQIEICKQASKRTSSDNRG